jgi:hypothetical protein
VEPISNADRLVLLLRQKLEERTRTGGVAGAGERAKSSPAVPAAGVRALAAVEGVDERDLRRTVIQNLLADQLKPAPINDAQFQQLVSRVTEAIEEDAEARSLLSEVVEELRRP